MTAAAMPAPEIAIERRPDRLLVVHPEGQGPGLPGNPEVQHGKPAVVDGMVDGTVISFALKYNGGDRISRRT